MRKPSIPPVIGLSLFYPVFYEMGETNMLMIFKHLPMTPQAFA